MILKDSFFNIIYRNNDNIKHIVSIRLNPEHYIYKSHFPGHPITPGVCLVQMATEILEDIKSKKLRIILLKEAKFTSILSPIDNPMLDYQFSQIDETKDMLKIKATAKNTDKTFAKLSIIYRIEG